MSEEVKVKMAQTQLVNEMRLNRRQWLTALAIIILVTWTVPGLWKQIETFKTGPDYRIPYSLSKDYWLYDRRLREIQDPGQILVLGDSVVWGEYVLPDGTWPHFLSRRAGREGQFVNAGVNGLFPLALEGLVRYHGSALRNRKVLLQCNVLWMSSPKADLQTDKEERFNHSHLVPQFYPRIPCYRASGNEKLGIVAERSWNFLGWVSHLQNAYFGQKSILDWTLEDDGKDPPHYPNSLKNPLAQITLKVPEAPALDPERGPQSPRHKPWSEGGNKPASFEWVDMSSSLQWSAFQRLVELLQERGNQVFVVLGPFNEHFIGQESRPGFLKWHEGIQSWLAAHHVPRWAPAVLPSDLYADASHPLTAGYELLARETWADEAFQKWLNAPVGR